MRRTAGSGTAKNECGFTALIFSLLDLVPHNKSVNSIKVIIIEVIIVLFMCLDWIRILNMDYCSNHNFELLFSSGPRLQAEAMSGLLRRCPFSDVEEQTPAGMVFFTI